MDEVKEQQPKRARKKPVAIAEKEPETTAKAAKPKKPKGYTAKVTAHLLNVREKPTKASKTICDPLPTGAIVEVSEVADGWAHLATGGYVMAEFIAEY